MTLFGYLETHLFEVKTDIGTFEKIGLLFVVTSGHNLVSTYSATIATPNGRRINEIFRPICSI